MNSVASRPDVGGIRPAVTLSPELFERIKIALDVARDSQGLFDPTVGPLVRAWGFLPSPTKPQNRARVVAAARTKVGWEKVKLDTVEHTVQFAAPDMEIDLGGIAKGYAAGKAAQVLREHRIQSGLVSLGASSITAIGNAPGGNAPGATGWRVFIRDPRDGESPAAWIDLHDGESLATSGTYEKTVSVGKSRHSHIIDPRTDEAIGVCGQRHRVIGRRRNCRRADQAFLHESAPLSRVLGKMVGAIPKAQYYSDDCSRW